MLKGGSHISCAINFEVVKMRLPCHVTCIKIHPTFTTTHSTTMKSREKKSVRKSAV